MGRTRFVRSETNSKSQELLLACTTGFNNLFDSLRPKSDGNPVSADLGTDSGSTVQQDQLKKEMIDRKPKDSDDNKQAIDPPTNVHPRTSKPYGAAGWDKRQRSYGDRFAGVGEAEPNRGITTLREKDDHAEQVRIERLPPRSKPATGKLLSKGPRPASRMTLAESVAQVEADSAPLPGAFDPPPEEDIFSLPSFAGFDDSRIVPVFIRKQRAGTGEEKGKEKTRKEAIAEGSDPDIGEVAEIAVPVIEGPELLELFTPAIQSTRISISACMVVGEKYIYTFNLSMHTRASKMWVLYRSFDDCVTFNEELRKEIVRANANPRQGLEPRPWDRRLSVTDAMEAFAVHSTTGSLAPPELMRTYMSDYIKEVLSLPPKLLDNNTVIQFFELYRGDPDLQSDWSNDPHSQLAFTKADEEVQRTSIVRGSRKGIMTDSEDQAPLCTASTGSEPFSLDSIEPSSPEVCPIAGNIGNPAKFSGPPYTFLDDAPPRGASKGDESISTALGSTKSSSLGPTPDGELYDYFGSYSWEERNYSNTPVFPEVGELAFPIPSEHNDELKDERGGGYPSPPNSQSPMNDLDSRTQSSEQNSRKVYWPPYLPPDIYLELRTEQQRYLALANTLSSSSTIDTETGVSISRQVSRILVMLKELLWDLAKAIVTGNIEGTKALEDVPGKETKGLSPTLEEEQEKEEGEVEPEENESYEDRVRDMIMDLESYLDSLEALNSGLALAFRLVEASEEERF